MSKGSFQDPRTLRLQPSPADFSGLGWAEHKPGRVAGPDYSQTSRWGKVILGYPCPSANPGQIPNL